MVGVDAPEEPLPDRPVVPDESQMTEDEKDFWHWFKDRLDKIKGWFGKVAGDEKEGENEGEEEKSG